jgi:hypothetical protein
MKKYFLFLYLVLTLIACSSRNNSSSSPPTAPQPGPQPTVPQSPVVKSAETEGGSTNVGGGGMGHDAKWKETASEIERNIRKLAVSKVEDSLFLQIKNRLPELIREAKVEFKDYPLILGSEKSDVDQVNVVLKNKEDDCKNIVGAGSQERDAINFSDSKKIKVNRRRFNCYDSKGAEIRKLILHEYLGLMGLTETENGVTHYKITNQLLEDFRSIPQFEQSLQVKLVSSCAGLQEIGVPAPSENHLKANELPPQVLWRLTQNLDCPRSFKPRVLNGNLDGDGYAIQNLTNFLFESICEKCSVSNLRLLDSKVEAVTLLAKINRGTISQVSVTGEIRTVWDGKAELYSPYVVGGLVASNQKGVIQSSRVDLRISAQKPDSGKELAIGTYAPVFGGLVGRNDNGIIQLVRVKLYLKEGVGRVGGVAGVNTGSIQDVESTISISSQSALAIGGIVGLNTGRVEDVVVNGQISVAGSKIQILDPSIYPPLDLGRYNPGIGGFIGNLHVHSQADPNLAIHFKTFLNNISGEVNICGEPVYEINLPALQKWVQDNPSSELDLKQHLHQKGHLPLGNEIGQFFNEGKAIPFKTQNSGAISAHCGR